MLHKLLVAMVFALSFAASSYASAADYVTGVLECDNMFVISLKSGTYLAVWRNDTANMSTWAYDHLYAMALELLSTGRQVGYYNAIGSPSTFCGVTAQEINVLQATNSP